MAKKDRDMEMLKQEAKALNIRGYTKMTRAEIRKIIKEKKEFLEKKGIPVQLQTPLFEKEKEPAEPSQPQKEADGESEKLDLIRKATRAIEEDIDSECSSAEIAKDINRQLAQASFTTLSELRTIMNRIIPDGIVWEAKSIGVDTVSPQNDFIEVLIADKKKSIRLPLDKNDKYKVRAR